MTAPSPLHPTQAQAQLLVDSACEVGESPVWNPASGCLAWVDITGQKLWLWNSTTGQTRTWPTPQRCGCIALADTNIHGNGDGFGVWLAAMETEVALLTPQANGEMTHTTLAKVTHRQQSMRFNDGRCDRQGRLLAGTMVQDPALVARHGQLYALEASAEQAALRPIQAGFLTPNGMGFSPDGRSMYLSDSHPDSQRVWRYQYDTDLGVPHSPELFIDMRDYPGRPDGAAIDVDGCYWICGNDAGLVHRFTPQGRWDRSVALPVKKPAMCAFGGADMRTLYITSIRPNGDLSDQPLAGGVFALDVGVEGMAEPQARIPTLSL